MWCLTVLENGQPSVVMPVPQLCQVSEEFTKGCVVQESLLENVSAQF